MTEDEFNEQEQDRFEARFFGALPEAEAAAFDAELARDAALKERYALFVLSVRGIQSSRKALKDTKAETLRERMRAIDAELDAHPTVVRSIVRPWVGWAAAAAVLITIAGAWWFMQGETPQQLAREFAIEEPGLPVLMSTEPRTLDAIMNAYKRQDLGTAMQLLERGLALDPANDTLNYFKGVIAERTDPGSAVSSYARVPAVSVFRLRVDYRLALVELREGRLGSARQLLSGVAASADVQLAVRARDLLDRLKDL